MEQFINKLGELSKKQLMLLAAKQHQQLNSLRPKESNTTSLSYQLEWQTCMPLPVIPAKSSRERWLFYVDSLAQFVDIQLLFSQKSIDLIPVLPQSLLNESCFEHPIAGVIFARAMDLHVTSCMSSTELSEFLQQACVDLLDLIQFLGQSNRTHGLKLCLVTAQAEYLGSQESIHLIQGCLRGLTTVIATEYPELAVQQIDFESPHLIANADFLLQEITQLELGLRIAYRGQQRYQARLIPMNAFAEAKISGEGSYLITGGLGHLGLQIARYLIEKGARSIILSSRRGELTDAFKQLQNECSHSGVLIQIVTADIADFQQVENLFAKIANDCPVLKGVIHAAGVLDDGVLSQQTYARFETVFAAKVHGAWNLHRLSASLPLDFFVLFSSVASQFGSAGQGNYAAANAFLDNLAVYRQCLGLPGLSLNWGPWAESGMAATKQFTRHGMQHLLPQIACQQFGSILSTRLAQVFIFHLNREAIERAIVKNPGLAILPLDPQPSIVKESFREQLVKAEHQEQFLQTFLIQQISSVLGLSKTATIAGDRLLIELGLDSLLAVELRNHLASATELKLPSGFIYDYPTLNQLLGFFRQTLLEPLETMPDKQASQSLDQSEPLAIIGMSCRFPGNVNDPKDYWTLLKNGICGITTLTNERWSMSDFYDASPDAVGKMYSRSAGLIDNVALFDADFFGISPREATSMDPQQRILLELAWQAIEDAGYDPLALKVPRGGVFVGLGPNDYRQLNTDPELIDAHIGTGNAPSVSAGRLSYQLGWRGPSMVIDTACSSSLVAVHLACRSLRSGESDIALAAGINLMLTPDANIALSRSRMLAADGLCKTFDSRADGYVRSEGAGLVVIKRLSDAVAAKDRVLAVIRGTSMNQDGRSQGLTAPNSLAQIQLMQSALTDASVQAKDIQVVEAHGTGTALGDPIEMQAINQVYGQSRTEAFPLTIASVKTNIGHTESAAGIAGLIKLVLCLQNEQIPAHLHLSELNPLLGIDDEFERQIVKIPTQLTPWPSTAPRLAALSSFGFSGTNAHLILAQAPISFLDASLPSEYLFTISAKTPAALQQLAEAYDLFLETMPDNQLEAMCYTANRGRHHFAYRFAMVVSNKLQLQHYLRHIAIEDVITNADHAITNIALLSGQSLTAFAEFYQRGGCIDWDDYYAQATLQKIALPTYPFQRQHYWLPLSKKFILNDVIDPVLGQSLPLPFSDEQRYLSLFNQKKPAYLADHQVFGTIVIPGASHTAMMLRAARQLFPESPFSLEDIHYPKALLINEGEQFQLQVIVGAETAQQRTMQVVSRPQEHQDAWSCHATARLKALTTPASAPVLPSIDELSQAEYFSHATFYQRMWDQGYHLGLTHAWVQEGWAHGHQVVTRLKLPNVGAELNVNDYPLFPGLIDSCQQAIDRCQTIFRDPIQNTQNIYIPYGIDEFRLYRQPDHRDELWCVIHHDETSSSINLINCNLYLFDKHRQLVAEIWGYKSRLTKADLFLAAAPKEQSLYQMDWQEKALTISLTEPSNPVDQEHWLLFSDKQGVAAHIVRELGHAIEVDEGECFKAITSHHYQVNPHRREDFLHLFQHLKLHDIKLSGVVHLWSLDDIHLDNLSDAVQRSAESALYLLQACLTDHANHVAKIVFVTQKNKNPAAGVMDGIGRVLNTEHPDMGCRCIDIESYDDRTLLLSELLQTDDEKIVRYRAGQRFVARLSNYIANENNDAPVILSNAAYMITGGLGGLGLAVAQWFVDQGAKHLVLLGRSPMQATTQHRVAIWQAQGVQVLVSQTDVANYFELETVFAQMQASMPALRGVVHAAGVLHDAILMQQTWASFDSVLRPKVQGAWNLHQLTQAMKLDFFSVFSSVTAILGTPGQANYAAANAFLDSFAHYRQSIGLCCNSINWSAWSQIGAAASRKIGEYHHNNATGLISIDPTIGIPIFASLIKQNCPQCIVMPMNWQQFSQHDCVPMHQLLLERFLVKKISSPSKSAESVAQPSDFLLSSLKNLDHAAKRKLLQTRILTLVAETLGIGNSEELLPHYRFFDIGMDSLMALTLKSNLQKELNCQLRSTLLFDYPTADKLTDYLLSEVLQEAQPEVAALPNNTVAERLKNKLRELHESV